MIEGILFVLLLLVVGASAWGVAPVAAKNAAARAYNAFNLASFTVGAKSVNTINVAVVLKGARGEALAAPVMAAVYLSDSADGHTLTATATTSALAIGTNGVLMNIDVTGKMCRVLTDTAGRFDLNLIQSASPVSEYLVVVLPDGSITVSSIITW